jgi:hypothetical protein
MTDNITLPRDLVERLVASWGRDTKAFIDSMDTLRAALAEPEPVHPGYILGSHWLETAYSRIAAGEVEAEVLTEVLGARGWAKPEPATVEQIDEEYIGPVIDARWHDFEAGFRAAERFHGIRARGCQK